MAANNEGYWQELDDGRDVYIETKDVTHNGPDSSIRFTPDRYSHIKHDPTTPSGRRKFTAGRHKVHGEARKKHHEDVRLGVFDDLPSSQGFYQCKNCGGGFVAKKADRKRGWARFCSKSCKAQKG